MKYSIDKVSDHPLHIDSLCNRAFGEDIKTYFEEDVLGSFKNMIFEIFLDLPQCNWIGQISKCILMLEIQQDNKDEIHVWVSWNILKFMMFKYAIITDLKCTGDIDEYMYTSSAKSALMSKYFPNTQGGITRSKLITRVKMGNFDNSEDALNLAILFFVRTFLFSQHREAPISLAHFQMVKDDFEIFDPISAASTFVAPTLKRSANEDQPCVVTVAENFYDFSTIPTRKFLRKDDLASPLSPKQASKRRKTVMFQKVSPEVTDVEKSTCAPSIRHVSGYVMPKGWRIYVYTRELNYDPRSYPDPYTFNPWRWMDKSLEHQNSFLVFGGGTRQCPGKELGVAEISTFLHYFVTKYRNCEVFVAAYAEILSEGQQVHSCDFDVGSQRARYASLLWHYKVTKADKGYTSDNDDPPHPRNSYLQSTDESAIVTLE
ncbi:Cytochrome 85A1 [Capsicum baccatum]|uniref:Cytochrome 85A1 n=1 Tax=Capsicum baccatum TaxID=33114 RepID=A0A2G2WD55_CAPBA|nr:Cytochrome 85A1 [Capsicum baccatum]